jgi:hypothetical protein
VLAALVVQSSILKDCCENRLTQEFTDPQTHCNRAALYGVYSLCSRTATGLCGVEAWLKRDRHTPPRVPW